MSKPCLSCNKAFKATGPFNRICKDCKSKKRTNVKFAGSKTRKGSDYRAT